jgi:tRNA (guanine37-N1)-methyltransferase
MHTQVIIKGGTVGQTSIPSIDIHDIARACASYGIKNFFIVSPLLDQQKIVATFMEFWLSSDGAKYNENRHQAISKIRPVLFVR